MELRQYFNVLRKWWWLIAAAMVIAGVAAFLGSLTTPRQYQARTTLMVGNALAQSNPNATDFYTVQSLAQSYGDLVRREPVLRGTLDELGLNWDWGTLQNMVSSRVVPGTQLIEIAVLDIDPQRAKVLTDEIVRQLILQSPAGADIQDDAERQFIQAQLVDLKENIKRSQEEIRQLDDVIAKATSARQIQDARTRQDSLRAQVSSWQSTYAGLSASLQQGSTNFLSVVERAQASSTPIGAGATTSVIIAAAIGLMLSGGAAFLLEYLDDTVKTPDDVRQLTELATLGGVPRIEGENYDTKVITLHQPRSPVAEAYRMVRTNLQFSVVDKPLQTLLVTSPNPEEGKSVSTANLAVVLAQAGKRVVLVDADLRRPVQHHIFELSNQTGLTTILLDASINLADVMQDTAVENLKVITSGPIPPNPSELLGSKRMGYLIDALKQQAELVIFDSPPVMAVSDASVLASRLDGALLVVDAGHTRRAKLRRSKENLDAVGASILGVVINRIHQLEQEYIYYYSQDTEPRRRAQVPALLGRMFDRTETPQRPEKTVGDKTAPPKKPRPSPRKSA
ncbi:MAG: polysaccharide biosynthesis tyrosine autokinase [Chloroflexi bacterium]|nr:polysaccharide biosynthesis tyrosine autokinase [Chloroflexota bacterium]